MNMLVVESQKKLVLHSKNPDAILQAIPHAKTFVHNGKLLTAVQHGMDEVKVLRNLGYKSAPAPILSYYDWPARFKAMVHQKETTAFMVEHDRAMCLNAPGTGKTISMLWGADYLLRKKLISRVLVIAPLSTLKPVWGSELMHHISHRNFTLLRGSRKRRLALLADTLPEFFVINHDGFSTMPDAFADFDLIIYDEMTALKTPTSQRYKKFAKFMDKYRPMLWGLTGTPISQNPTDVWTLAKLIGSTAVPSSYTHFKDITMRRVTQFRWVPRDEALEICKAVLQPSVRYALDDCIDLPETSYLVRECDLTGQQVALFKEMREEASIMGTNITAANAAVMFQKLLQICCGVVYDSEGNHIVFDDRHRIEALIEIIEEAGDKIIVFVPLRGVQDRIVKLLAGIGYDVAAVHGGVTGKARDDIFDTFQNSDKIQVLVAHPKVAAHGLTLTRASSIVWYAPIYSLEMYEQANARIRRLSTKGKTMVHHICATMFERELYSRLQHRKRVLANFLELVMGVNE